MVEVCPNCQGTQIEADPFTNEMLCMQCGAVVRENRLV